MVTYATMSVTSFVVGFIAFLKKFTTTELKRSRSAGNRRKACYMREKIRYDCRAKACEKD